MKSVLKAVVSIAAALSMLACGGGEKVADKETAAAVLVGISGSSSSQGKKGNALTALAANAMGASQTADCPKGGKVSVKMDMDGFGMPSNFGPDATGAGAGMGSGTGTPSADQPFGGDMNLEAAYDGCAIEWDDPATEEVEKDEITLTGDMKMGMKFSFAETNSTTTVSLKGKLELGGALSDTFDADVVQTFAFGSTGDAVNMSYVVNGHVKTSAESFVFENDSFDISADAAGNFKAKGTGQFGDGSFDSNSFNGGN